MKISNQNMYQGFMSLQEIMDKVSGRLGYVVAYNMRMISNELREYESYRNKAISDYGTPDENGISSIPIGSDAYKHFLEEMKQYDDIEHEVNLLKVNPEDIYSSALTAKDIYNISFMINEGNGDECSG